MLVEKGQLKQTNKQEIKEWNDEMTVVKIPRSWTEKMNKTAPETVFHLRCIKRDECLCVTVSTPSEYDLPWCGM